jgi:hypothetical protein
LSLAEVPDKSVKYILIKSRSSSLILIEKNEICHIIAEVIFITVWDTVPGMYYLGIIRRVVFALLGFKPINLLIIPTPPPKITNSPPATSAAINLWGNDDHLLRTHLSWYLRVVYVLRV